MKQKIITIMAITLFLTALILTLYPVISNYVNQQYASEIQTAYQEIVAQTDDSALEEAMVQAAAYNLSLLPGATEAYSQEQLTAAVRDYNVLLNIADNGIMGYVRIPKISVDLPIYHGTEAEELERSVCNGCQYGCQKPMAWSISASTITGLPVFLFWLPC